MHGLRLMSDGFGSRLVAGFGFQTSTSGFPMCNPPLTPMKGPAKGTKHVSRVSGGGSLLPPTPAPAGGSGDG